MEKVSRVERNQSTKACPPHPAKTRLSSYSSRMNTISALRVFAFGVALLAQWGNAFDIMPGVASRAWGVYKEMLRTDPLLTKSLTSSSIMTVSDVICQKLVMANTKTDRKETDSTPTPSLDYVRMLQVAITGIVWSGPIQHWWFGTLDKIVTIQHPILRLVVKLIFDSMIFSPLTISGYFTVRSMLEGSGFKGAYEKLSTRLVSTVKGAWKFWPIVNIVNFGLVPLQFRVLYSNILSLFWTGYLTYVNSKKISRNANSTGDGATTKASA